MSSQEVDVVSIIKKFPLNVISNETSQDALINKIQHDI